MTNSLFINLVVIEIKVYRTEIEMEQDLNALGQYIELKPFDAY